MNDQSIIWKSPRNFENCGAKASTSTASKLNATAHNQYSADLKSSSVNLKKVIIFCFVALNRVFIKKKFKLLTAVIIENPIRQKLISIRIIIDGTKNK